MLALQHTPYQYHGPGKLEEVCVCVCVNKLRQRRGIGLVLFDCVFVLWVKKEEEEAGIGFRMSLCFTGWPWVCQGGEGGAEREGGERGRHKSTKTKILQ